MNFAPREDAESFLGAGTVVGDDLFLDTGLDALPSQKEPGYLDPSTMPDPTDPDEDNFDPLTGSGTEGDGRFQEGEPLMDRGQRLLVNPRIALPLRLGDVAELRTELGYHGTFYNTHAQSFETRHLGTAQVDLRTRLRRELELPFDAGRATHLLEPRLAWTGITDVSQDDNPLLVPRGSVLQERIRQLELGNVLRDPSDRIEETNAVTLAFGNRLFVPTPPGEKGILEPPRLFADVTLSGVLGLRRLRPAQPVPGRRGVPDAHSGARASTPAGTSTSPRSPRCCSSSATPTSTATTSASRYRKVRDVPAFFDNFSIEDERFDDAEDELRRDQPGRAVRALCVHALLGGQLSAPLLVRGLDRAHQPGRNRVRVALQVLGRAPRVRAGPPGRLSGRRPLPDRRPRRRHRPPLRRPPPRRERPPDRPLLTRTRCAAGGSREGPGTAERRPSNGSACLREWPLITSGFPTAFRPPPEGLVLRPEPSEFGRLAAQGNLIPVVREILADLDTPLSLFRALDDGRTSFLLESVEGGEKWARYSFIGTGARALFRARGRSVEWVEGGRDAALRGAGRSARGAARAARRVSRRWCRRASTCRASRAVRSA